MRTPVPEPKPHKTGISSYTDKTIEVKAPLPGKILQIKVAAGESFKKGDTLIIMEAMKMENNILADADGTVIAIQVKEGESVLQDHILLIAE